MDFSVNFVNKETGDVTHVMDGILQDSIQQFTPKHTSKEYNIPQKYTFNKHTSDKELVEFCEANDGLIVKIELDSFKPEGKFAILNQEDIIVLQEVFE